MPTPTEDANDVSYDKAQVVMDKSRSATSWVNAALTSDLASFSVQSKQAGSGTHRNFPKRASSQQLQVMLDNGPSTVPRGRSSSPSMSSRATSSPKTRAALATVTNEKKSAAESRSHSPVPVLTSRRCNAISRIGLGKITKTSSKVVPEAQPPDQLKIPPPAPTPATPPAAWVRGKGVAETSELAKKVQNESQRWFLNFMEGALDVGFHIATSGIGEREDIYGAKVMSQQENSHIATMLSQLKRVNDWLDQVGDGLDTKLIETKARLKRKIYDFLLQHVESAAAALGNVSSVTVYSKPQLVNW